MSKPEKTDDLEIRTAWWESFLKLEYAISELEGPEATKEELRELAGRLSLAFNAAWFRNSRPFMQ